MGEHATFDILLQTLVPMILAIFSISNKKTIFDVYSSSAVLVALLAPTLLRNFTNVSTKIDYSMISLSNLCSIMNFAVKMYSNNSYYECLVALIRSEGTFAKILLLSFVIDVVLCLIGCKHLSVCFKVIYAILLLIGINSLGVESDIATLGFLLIMVPTFILFMTSNSDHKACTLSTILSIYCAFFTYYVEYNSASFERSNLKTFLGYGKILMRKIAKIPSYFN